MAEVEAAEAEADHVRRAQRWLRWLTERVEAASAATRAQGHASAEGVVVSAYASTAAGEGTASVAAAATAAEALPPSSQRSPPQHADDAMLTAAQHAQLGRLLLEALCDGSSSRGSAELAHGGVRLQLGATLHEVELCLMRPAPLPAPAPRPPVPAHTANGTAAPASSAAGAPGI